MKFRISLCLIVVSLYSCKTLNGDKSYEEMVRGASTPAQKLISNPEFEACDHRSREIFDNVMLKNNLWGASKLKEGSNPVLCTFKRGDYMGWKWELPDNAGGVIGYPSVMVGKSPFDRSNTSPSEFPILLTNLNFLNVSYDFETHVKHKKYNLAFDLWLVDKNDYDRHNITTEIMIWEDYFDFTSYGKKQETIITPFGTYEVFRGHLENPEQNQDWQYIAFVRTATTSKNVVDISFFLSYLMEENKISPSDYLTSIELGNEIGNSSGITLIKEFAWNLSRKSK